MIRLLAGDFRDEVEASRARMASVIAVLNHPGHDQSSHGRKGDSVERARERQAAIDTAKGFGTASSKLDELANNEATARTIAHFADRFEREGTLTAGEANKIREAGGDYQVLRDVSDAVAQRSGLTPIGRAGDRVTFNPREHELIDRDNPPNGRQVEIVRRGHDFAYADESIRIARAVVEPV